MEDVSFYWFCLVFPMAFLFFIKKKMFGFVWFFLYGISFLFFGIFLFLLGLL